MNNKPRLITCLCLQHSKVTQKSHQLDISTPIKQNPPKHTKKWLKIRKLTKTWNLIMHVGIRGSFMTQINMSKDGSKRLTLRQPYSNSNGCWRDRCRRNDERMASRGSSQCMELSGGDQSSIWESLVGIWERKEARKKKRQQSS